MGKHSSGQPVPDNYVIDVCESLGATRAAGDITIKRPSHIPGLKDVRLTAQPTYRFCYRGQPYAANFDRDRDVWVVSWIRDTDGQMVAMTVRQTLDDAVKDALDDVDALHEHLR